MADIEKTTGQPIDDEELGGVVGGVSLCPGLSQDDLERMRNALNSGEFKVEPNPNTINTINLTKPADPPGTVSPLDSEATRIAEELRQGMNRGGLPVNTK